MVEKAEEYLQGMNKGKKLSSNTSSMQRETNLALVNTRIYNSEHSSSETNKRS